MAASKNFLTYICRIAVLSGDFLDFVRANAYPTNSNLATIDLINLFLNCRHYCPFSPELSGKNVY